MDFDKVKEGSDYLIKVTKTRPKIGIICGSGVGELKLTYFDSGCKYDNFFMPNSHPK